MISRFLPTFPLPQMGFPVFRSFQTRTNTGLSPHFPFFPFSEIPPLYLLARP